MELNQMSDFVQYNHHGVTVWTTVELKGKHREHCLCFACAEFHPGPPEENCPIANLNYAGCLAHHVTLPVYECPLFVKAVG
jgi:hypothetical protein